MDTMVHTDSSSWHRGLLRAACTGCLIAMGPGTATAGSFDFWGIDAEWQLIGSYAYAIRLENPHAGVVDTPGRAQVPIPEYLKYPESNNYDDGDRNFDRYDAVNNRVTALGEVQFKWENYGALLRADAFYDEVYHGKNDNKSPDTINTTQEPFNSFTDAAEKFSGGRARLLDAYAYGSWYIGDSGALNVRAGKHIAAWGESLFMYGVALSQSPADATKATVPGADVKSILLPVNQISMQWSLNDSLTILGQYKLEFKEFELNPVGEFFSVADVVGPGAEFIYGIRNPFFFDNLSEVDIASNDMVETINLIQTLTFGEEFVPVPGVIPEELNGLMLPQSGQAFPGTPTGINVQRGPDIVPSDHGQYGLGLRYQLNSTTTVGAYRLRYHNMTPAPVQNYGYAVLVPSQGPGLPPVTTEHLGELLVPVTYNIKFFDGIDLSALSWSTVLFGTNFAGEFIWREGVDVLVDVWGGALLGPIPTPTRSDVAQVLLSGLYVAGPALWWDSLAIVGETAFIHVENIDPALGPDGETYYDDLTFSRDAWGYSALALMDTRNVFDGWDLNITTALGGIGKGQSSLLGGLGSLMGEGDYRLGLAFNFTRLNRLTLGVAYNGFLGGRPHFSKRPYQDRDTLAFTAKYSF